MAAEDKALREKCASTMLRLEDENSGHKKRAHALRLLWKQAEMGVGELPQTYGELQAKLASMVREDLGVLERALELTGGTVKMGELGGPELQALDATAQFQATVLGN